MLLIVMLTPTSIADVVGPDPTDCPSGSIGTSNHGGSFCSPQAPCTGTCPGDETCAPIGLCVLEEERPCSGNVEQPCTYTHIEATGTCEGPSDCSGDTTTCVIADRCAVPDAPAVDTADGCGCTSTGVPALMVVLGLLPLAFRRRTLV